MASQMGVDTIVACDRRRRSLVMTESATKVLKSNLNESQRKKITILNSERTIDGGKKLPKLVQHYYIGVIWCRLAGVFGEHVIEVLCDAYSLLSAQNHLIFPYRVQGFLVGGGGTSLIIYPENSGYVSVIFNFFQSKDKTYFQKNVSK